jgi:hypothetical protein
MVDYATMVLNSLTLLTLVLGTTPRQIDPPPRKVELVPEWWQRIKEGAPTGGCFVIFLGLPGDSALSTYLSTSRTELDRLTGDTCTVLVPAEEGPVYLDLNQRWLRAVAESLNEGGDLANWFKVPATAMPALVLFKDLDRHAAWIPMNGMSLEEVRAEVRRVLTIVGDAAKTGRDPLSMKYGRKRKWFFRESTLKVAGRAVLAVILRVLAHHP